MPEVSGSCASKLQSQTMVPVHDRESHQIGLMVMQGKHSSPDPRWNDAMLTYTGMADITGTDGKQDGYFVNQHPNGDTSGGTFEATVTMVEGLPHLQGKWHLTFGTGTLENVKGAGRFEASMTSPVDSQMTWSGAYEL
ncbi:MAG TPA: hypothetical protein VE690_23825 [Rhodopila sp.]|nr:hypothetical protein [Rhodopila sp.]